MKQATLGERPPLILPRGTRYLFSKAPKKETAFEPPVPLVAVHHYYRNEEKCMGSYDGLLTDCGACGACREI
jgi:hypothetical protein